MSGRHPDSARTSRAATPQLAELRDITEGNCTMTHPRIEQINQSRSSVERVVLDFNHVLDGIRGHRSLSNEGKRDAIASAYVNAKATIDGLLERERERERERQTIADWRAELERSIFGWQPTTNLDEIRVRRDSNEQADQLDDPRDAVAMYEAARVRSDVHLESAVVARSLAMGWHAVTDHYLASNPERAAEVSDLRGLNVHLGDELQQVMHYALMRPTELANVALGSYTATAAAPLLTEFSDVSGQQATAPATIRYDGPDGRPGQAMPNDGLNAWRVFGAV